MPSEPVAKVNQEAVLIGNKIIARFQTQLFSEAVAEALNTALAPILKQAYEDGRRAGLEEARDGGSGLYHREP
jgi:flagellar biosynthesis/type III secretory pathway protein FliH